jgi:HAD superfamily hydrolase (TIGR01549 family)
MVELVIFDADGVLFDSTLSNTAYYNAIFAAMDEPPMSPAEEKAGVYLAAPQVFEMRAGADPVRLQRMREIAQTLDATPFFNMMIPALELRPFMTELKRNYRLGLATNRSATIPSLIDFLGLDGIFDAVASVRDKVKPKPAPDIIKLCIERAGTQPHKAVYVGDSATDQIAAEGAGSHYIGLGDRSGRERGHDHRIDLLAELPEKLERLFKPAH